MSATSPKTAVVTLLTDYGSADDFVGVCHGVIRRIAPHSAVIDVTHGISRHDIRHGAVVLANTLPYMPVGIHVAVVDPQVGTERRAVAIRTADDRVLVGPDNGVLSLAWERVGGVVEAIDISRSQHRLEPVAATFHGRDIFAPVAAQLAAGAELRDSGDPLAVDALARISLPEPAVADGLMTAHALLVDRFGNVALNVRHEQIAGSGLKLGAPVEITVAGERYLGTFARAFADVRPGEVIVYEDAYRTLALAINRGDAAATLQIRPDDEIVLSAR